MYTQEDRQDYISYVKTEIKNQKRKVIRENDGRAECIQALNLHNMEQQLNFSEEDYKNNLSYTMV